MHILDIRDYFLRKIRIVFGLIEYECRTIVCECNGRFQQIQFHHPKNEEVKISLIIYDKDHICIHTEEHGMTCYKNYAVYEVEKRLEELYSTVTQ